MKIAEQVTFGGSGLNRAAELRSDPAKIQKLMMASNARAMGLWQGKPLFANDEVDRIAWLPLDGPISKFSEEAPIFLGLDGDAPLFCFRIDNWSPDESPDSIGSFFDPSLQAFPNTDDECVFGDLKASLTKLSPRDAELAATAKALWSWHGTHGYCAV